MKATGPNFQQIDGNERKGRRRTTSVVCCVTVEDYTIIEDEKEFGN
jgi:hypothetical protein